MDAPTREPLLTFSALPMQGETVYLEVKLARTDASLGHIGWYPPWRQYVFVPTPAGRYTRSVLKAVNVKLARLAYAWGKAHPNSKRGKPVNAVDYEHVQLSKDGIYASSGEGFTRISSEIGEKASKSTKVARSRTQSTGKPT